MCLFDVVLPSLLSDPPMRSWKGSHTIMNPSLVEVMAVFVPDRKREQVNFPDKLLNSDFGTFATYDSKLKSSQLQKITESFPVDMIDSLFLESKQTVWWVSLHSGSSLVRIGESL
jgi:hypothetical protein